MSKRSYSDADKALALTALQANAGDWEKTAGQINIPSGTLKDWHYGKGLNKDVLAIHQETNFDLVEELRKVAINLTGGFTPEKIAQAKLSDIGVALGIVVDKMELLNGNATSRTENVNSDYQEKLARLREQKLQLAKKVS